MQFLDFKGLSEFLKGLFGKFSEIGHKHTTSDITDYVVDSSLSSTSTNPLQNKVINAEFDAVSEAMGALEAAIDDKLDTSTASSTYETKEDAQLKYDTITDAKADWNQNDENAIDYVKNRTHYDNSQFIEVVPEQSVTKQYAYNTPWGLLHYDTASVANMTLKTSVKYKVVLNGVEYFTECKDGDSNPYFGNHAVLNQNGVNTGEPFIVTVGEVNALAWYGEYGETITLAIYEQQGDLVQLDEKFIPDTIARTDYVHENFALKSDVKDVDLSAYETKADAQLKYDNAVAHSDANLETAKNYVDTVASGKASSSHTHDNMYYTEAEMDSKLSAKSDKTHNHDTVYDTKGSAEDALTESKEYTDSVASGKADLSHAHSISNVTNLQSSLDAKVPTSRTVNGKALSANITLSASDVKADASGTASSAVSTHNTSTSAHSDIRALITDLTTKLNNFLDVDDTTTDQLSEVITLINNNKGTLESLTTSKINVSDIVDNLTTSSTSKVLSAKQGVAIKALIDALQSELDSHTHAIADVSGLQSALDGKAASSHGTHVSYSSTAPVMDGTASVGTASTVARSDHKHPTDTSRASQSSLDSHTGNTTSHITSTERTNWNAAKTHADSAHAPSNAQANQNAFSNIKVGSTTISADTTTDTLELVGSNVTITPDATNDKVTIAVADGSTSAKGLVQLTNSTSSTSTTTAATPSSVKSAYDLANTAKTNAATAQSRADSAYSLAESKADSLSDLGITATTTELNYVDGVTSNIQTQLDSKAASGHTHDDRYYTETEIDSKLSGKANSSHGNHVPATETANSARFLRNDNTWQTVTPSNIGALPVWGGKLYSGIFGGGQDKNWKKIIRFSCSITTAPTSGMYCGLLIWGKIRYHNGNHVQERIDEYNFQIPCSFVGGTAITDNVKLLLPPTMQRDLIRIVKVSTNYYELQLRQVSDWQKMEYEFSCIGSNNTITVESFEPVVDATNTTVNNDYKTNRSALQYEDYATASDLISHTGNTSNPHGVTKSQVGLGNVENKSSSTILGELTKTHVTAALGYTPPTTNTTYGVATSSALGLVKSGTDITVDSSGNVSVNDGSHNHAASNITSGTLAVARGGTGVTSNPSMLTNLGSTSAASVFATSPRPGVTGTLPIANGGTGATTAANARTALDVPSNSRLGGLSFVKLTQAEYNALTTKDANTIYFTT